MYSTSQTVSENILEVNVNYKEYVACVEISIT